MIARCACVVLCKHKCVLARCSRSCVFVGCLLLIVAEVLRYVVSCCVDTRCVCVSCL